MGQYKPMKLYFNGMEHVPNIFMLFDKYLFLDWSIYPHLDWSI